MKTTKQFKKIYASLSEKVITINNIHFYQIFNNVYIRKDILKNIIENEASNVKIMLETHCLLGNKNIYPIYYKYQLDEIKKILGEN